MPGSEFTLQSAGSFLAALLGRSTERVTGEVTKVGSRIQITVRVPARESLTDSFASADDISDADHLVVRAAELTMQLAYPYVLAASLYNDEKNDESSTFFRTLQVLDYMVKGQQDLYYAHNLKCNVLVRLYKLADAEQECRQAIGIDSTNWPAQANLGYVYYAAAQKGFSRSTGGATEEAKANCRKALPQFEKAEKSHPLLFLYDRWADCLEALGDHEAEKRLRDKTREDAESKRSRS